MLSFRFHFGFICTIWMTVVEPLAAMDDLISLSYTVQCVLSLLEWMSVERGSVLVFRDLERPPCGWTAPAGSGVLLISQSPSRLAFAIDTNLSHNQTDPVHSRPDERKKRSLTLAPCSLPPI